ncbi:UDP-4-amino-4,6-dideoxy-N-acetyl-beta-L-altrosamine N-acetyltransferase [Hymenobacter busanensis]|uniref:UDP-4-amino-4, 6-dideoxy-N-acetyl-beta-L-altrosamine N-acetyltransferase n=1 Tax=Hymenobacter busanensis TaxID=2607656 RepID=A0A7L4ZUC5_9BACT|nr:UDP-4-amino-4,6-dideoxy-N-acetyl-beta-L-altrosamine N-acetyltransferase [Hymenobacter busanensis]KAA9339461.1 UDP-4-amino-4,6-dideoxy-N-acetyl-beta-L-altrosamine N-acetyltransferase [Hymenobacter busanensis]QHJ06781.1 UDP-4-amino-4,6-dideoxy-N-acetyl-beta-L-altrosamine N-acetyltransferase [Hymenobacter busanensis]
MTTDILRPLQHQDLEMVRNWRNSEAVAQYMYSSEPITAEQQKAWFASISADASKQYWIITYQGRDVGVANLYAINQAFQSCYWAFYLGDQNLRGTGIGAKVEFTVLEYVFSELKLNKLLCEVFVDNDKVIGMHEKFGFRRESYFREHIRKDGVFKDVVGLAMLQREWLQVREALQARVFRR